MSFLNTVTPESVFTKVNRREKDGTIAEVPCPAAVRYYNKYMGGVDLADNLRRSYSFSLKSRRWHMRLFWYLLESAAVNAFILRKETTGQKTPQVKFRVALAMELMPKFCSRQRPGRQSIVTAGRYRDRHFPRNRKRSLCR